MPLYLKNQEFETKLGVVYNQSQLLEKTQKDREAFRHHANQEPAIAQKQVYLLVLGERARYDHFGINGYHRNTTPKLSQISNLLSFSNMSSGA